MQVFLVLVLTAAAAQKTEAQALEKAAQDTGLSNVQVFVLMEAYQGKSACKDLPDFFGFSDVQAFILAEVTHGYGSASWMRKLISALGDENQFGSVGWIRRLISAPGDSDRPSRKYRP
jgi:hypothetical protein